MKAMKTGEKTVVLSADRLAVRWVDAKVVKKVAH